MATHHYKSNYLTNVVCRFDLLNAPELGGTTRPALSEAVAKLFPRFSAKPSAQLSVVVGPQGPQMTQGVAGFSYEHRRGDRVMPVVVVGAGLLSIEYGPNDYDHFVPFKEEVEQILAALAKHHPQAAIARIGLRYVNEIRLDQGGALDWGGLVNPALIASVKAGVLPDWKLTKSMHQLHTTNDDVSLLIHYGLPNPDYPGDLVRRHFVIDIDAFKSGPVPLGEAAACVSTLNAACEETFESFIDQDLRAKMGVLDA